MSDVKAMYWKELKDLFSKKNMQGILRLLFAAGVGIWISLQFAHNWVQLPLLGIVFLSIYPLLIIFSFVADVFAGERERHTLESLLASRLSNWSIVVGKCAALVTLSWGMTIISMGASLVVVNVMAGGHAWSFYPPDRLLIALVLSLVISVFATTIGALVSLRAATVRQAQQMLSYGTIGLGVGTSFLATSLPHMSFFSHGLMLGDIQILLIVLTCMAIVDGVLFTLVLSLFQRSRLLWN